MGKPIRKDSVTNISESQTKRARDTSTELQQHYEAIILGGGWKDKFHLHSKKNHIVSNDNNPDESDNKEGGQPGWMITITQTQQSSFEKEYRTQLVSETEVAVGIAEKIYFLNTRALNKFGW